MSIPAAVHVPRALFELIVWLPPDRQFAALDQVVADFRAVGDLDAAEAFDVDARKMLAHWRARGSSVVGHA